MKLLIKLQEDVTVNLDLLDLGTHVLQGVGKTNNGMERTVFVRKVLFQI